VQVTPTTPAMAPLRSLAEKLITNSFVTFCVHCPDLATFYCISAQQTTPLERIAQNVSAFE